MVTEGETLTVLWDGVPIGQMTITHIQPRVGLAMSLDGTWTPFPAFADYRPHFEEYDRQYQVYAESDEDADLACKRWFAAIRAVTQHLQIPGLPGPLSDFSLDKGRVGLTISHPVTLTALWDGTLLGHIQVTLVSRDYESLTARLTGTWTPSGDPQAARPSEQDRAVFQEFLQQLRIPELLLCKLVDFKVIGSAAQVFVKLSLGF